MKAARIALLTLHAVACIGCLALVAISVHDLVTRPFDVYDVAYLLVDGALAVVFGRWFWVEIRAGGGRRG